MPPPLSIRPQPPENRPQSVPWGAKVQKRSFQFFGGVPGEEALFVALVNAVHNSRKTLVRTFFLKYVHQSVCQLQNQLKCKILNFKITDNTEVKCMIITLVSCIVATNVFDRNY